MHLWSHRPPIQKLDTKCCWPHDLRGLANLTKVGLLLLSWLELLKGQAQAPNPGHHGKVHWVSEPWTPGVQAYNLPQPQKYSNSKPTHPLWSLCRWMQLFVYRKMCCTSTVVHPPLCSDRDFAKLYISAWILWILPELFKQFRQFNAAGAPIIPTPYSHNAQHRHPSTHT